MLKLSKKGTDLIKYYKRMAKEGYDRIDGIKVQSAYNDFELQKFRNVVVVSGFRRYDLPVVKFGCVVA